MNEKTNYVIANLVATYDISPTNAQTAAQIDYLCIYEYEYGGKKYKYRTHQKDNFSPIPETIELSIGKDPNKAYKINNSYKKNETKSSSSINFMVVIWVGLILACLFIIGIFYMIVQSLLDTGLEFNMFSVLIFIFIIFIIGTASVKTKKNRENLDEEIEEAILNNRTTTAHLIKTRSRFGNEENSTLRRIHNEYPYEGIYTYNYNGKKYTKKFTFRSSPPVNLRLFFGKNPKNIIHFN